MRDFNYDTQPEKLLTPEIVQMLCKIHEYKGRQKLLHRSAAEKLHLFPRTAAIQSAEAYSRFEDVDISGKNLEKLIKNQIKPSTKEEDEIIGYLAALAYAGKNYQFEKLNTEIIINMYRRLDPASRGAAKVNPWTRPELLYVANLDSLRQLEKLCDSFNKAWDDDHIDKLILIGMFFLDFYNIQPFDYGSEKMCRLLLQLLLLRAGYIVVKYVSTDSMIEESRRTYQNVLRISSAGWQEEKNEYLHFIVYLLGILVRDYSQFEQLTTQLTNKKISKPDRIRSIIDARDQEPVTKRELLAMCPDISKITIERALNDMVKESYVKKVGAGPSTAYVRS